MKNLKKFFWGNTPTERKALGALMFWCLAFVFVAVIASVLLIGAVQKVHAADFEILTDEAIEQTLELVDGVAEEFARYRERQAAKKLQEHQELLEEYQSFKEEIASSEERLNEVILEVIVVGVEETVPWDDIVEPIASDIRNDLTDLLARQCGIELR